MTVRQRIFVDCQVFQYNTWNRGMGRYTLKLLEALDKKDLELILIFNRNIDFEPARRRAVIAACPGAQIMYLKLSHSVHANGGWRKLQQLCAAELDSQLGGVLKPSDTYLIASNFVLRYCSTFPNLACNKAIIFYDLTPYLQWADYQHSLDFEPGKYFAQLITVFNADQLWSISESAANEAKHWLGIDSDKVFNIRGASIRNLDEPVRALSSLSDQSKFLLSPSADGPNKNNETMVRAFAEFNAQVNGIYTLVITSNFSARSQIMLSEISKDLIFAGHVSDGELGWLYEHCAALLFVSKTEGLGLPILEAVHANKKVVCSDIPVFREISADAFYYANPNSVSDVAEALRLALVDNTSWEHKQSQYEAIGHTFSWSTVAETCQVLMAAPASEKGSGLMKYSDIWYADPDHVSDARNVAELLYAHNPALAFHSVRVARYTHVYPSYLVEMGVAINAFMAHPLEDSQPLYLIDNSMQGAQLLLYALQTPGTILVLLSEKAQAKQITQYVRKNISETLDYRSLMQLAKAAGNSVQYKVVSSPRGSLALVEEVVRLETGLTKGGASV